MKKNTILFLLTILCFVSIVWADDVDVNLNSNDGTTGFSVKNNAGTPATVLRAKSNGDIVLRNNSHLNVGTGIGDAGYGFRDNNGTMEYKNNGGTWAPFGYVDNDVTSPYGFGAGAYSYGQISYNHGNYGTTQPSVEIGADSAYETMLPVTLGSGGGTPWEVVESGDVSVVNLSSKPAYLKINAPGLYRISASVAIKGTSNTSIEVEVFRQNSGTVPTTTSWITLTHDLESLSTAISVTTNQYDAGSVNGVFQLAANDYLALCSRVVSGSTSTQKVICINFNVERVK